MIAYWCGNRGRHNSWYGHLGNSAMLVGLGGLYVILQAAWKLCGLCINDQMQIVPSGHSLFSKILLHGTHKDKLEGVC